MHENREISCTSWSKDQDRSAKAINRTADVHVQEKSDCAVVPVNQPNNEGRFFRGGWGGKGADQGEHRSISHAPDSERETHVPGTARCAASSIPILMPALPLFILGKSRIRKRARTDLRGGRSAMVVPTATVICRWVAVNALMGSRRCKTSVRSLSDSAFSGF